MVPEGIDNRPREIVPMVLAGKLENALRDWQFLAEEEATPVILHEQDPDQQHDHRSLRTEDRDILRQPIVPDVRLDKVQENEQRIYTQSYHVHWM